MVYKNEQIEDIINIMPRTIKQLKSIRGFGDIKCEKYGRDIIKIVEKYIQENLSIYYLNIDKLYK